MKSDGFPKAFGYMIARISNESFELDAYTQMVVQFHLTPSSTHVPYTNKYERSIMKRSCVSAKINRLARDLKPEV